MAKYDFFIAGRWRNKDNIKPVLDAVRASGKTAYCFIENTYKGEAIEFKMDENPDAFMKQSEALSQDDPLIRKIFEVDVTAEYARVRLWLWDCMLRVCARYFIQAGNHSPRERTVQ